MDALYVSLHYRYCVVLAVWSLEAEATGTLDTKFASHIQIPTVGVAGVVYTCSSYHLRQNPGRRIWRNDVSCAFRCVL